MKTENKAIRVSYNEIEEPVDAAYNGSNALVMMLDAFGRCPIDKGHEIAALMAAALTVKNSVADILRKFGEYEDYATDSRSPI